MATISRAHQIIKNQKTWRRQNCSQVFSYIYNYEKNGKGKFDSMIEFI